MNAVTGSDAYARPGTLQHRIVELTRERDEAREEALYWKEQVLGLDQNVPRCLGLTDLEARALKLLLKHDMVSRGLVTTAECRHTIVGLRRKLLPWKITVETLVGEGYALTPENKARVRALMDEEPRDTGGATVPTCDDCFKPLPPERQTRSRRCAGCQHKRYLATIRERGRARIASMPPEEVAALRERQRELRRRRAAQPGFLQRERERKRNYKKGRTPEQKAKRNELERVRKAWRKANESGYAEHRRVINRRYRNSPKAKLREAARDEAKETGRPVEQILARMFGHAEAAE
jgi:hypothetical protein